MLADVGVSFPLGPTDREPMQLPEDSMAGAPWTVVGLCRTMESIETMDGVLETTGKTVLSLPPQGTV